MSRQMIPMDIFESNPASWILPVPDHSEFRGLVADPKNPDCIHLWFEGDPDFHPTTVAFRIIKAGEDIPNDMDMIGSDLATGRHVFRGKFQPKCRCDCKTKHPGVCNHDWNGEYVQMFGTMIDMTCSNCGMRMSEHGPINLANPPKSPRLRRKSSFQKDDCIACVRPSTKEVVWRSAQIRCCGDPDCIEKATELATSSGL